MNYPKSSRASFVIAVAVSSVLPVVGEGAATRTITGGTAQTGTSWFTTTNWDGGIYAGVPTAGVGGIVNAGYGAADDIASTAATLKIVGFGINFGYNSTGLAGGTLTLGSIIHNSTALGSAGTSPTLLIGNSGTTAPTGSTTITGTVALNGSTLNVGATGGTLNNVVAAISDTATTNLSLVNQAVGTTPGTTTLTYLMNTATPTFYAPTGRTLAVSGTVAEATGTSATLVKEGAGTLELGTQSTTLANSAVNTLHRWRDHQRRYSCRRRRPQQSGQQHRHHYHQ